VIIVAVTSPKEEPLLKFSPSFFIPKMPHGHWHRLRWMLMLLGMLLGTASAACTTPAANAVSTSNATSTTAIPSELLGRWRGVIQYPQHALVLGFDIQAEGEQLKLRLDSPLQGNFGFVPQHQFISRDRLYICDDRLNIAFDGKLDASNSVNPHSSIHGTFTQGQSQQLRLEKLDATALARLPQEGAWHGALTLPNQQKLPLVLHVAVMPTGYRASLDSPSQQSYGIPITNIQMNDTALSFEAPIIGASYRARWQAASAPSDLSSSVQGQPADVQPAHWQGTFTQGGELPLNFSKNKSSQKKSRQNAAKQTAPASTTQALLQPLLDSLPSSDSPIAVALAILSTAPHSTYTNSVAPHSSVATTTTAHGTITSDILVTSAPAHKKSQPNVDEHTLFEIGSISKTMTAYLVADQLASAPKARWQLNSPISQLWPELGPQHHYDLRALLLHRSGLPRLPADLWQNADPNDPYRHYTRLNLQQYLTSLPQPTQSAQLEYSNLGYGLLGELLARQHNKPLAHILQQKLFIPFGMRHSQLATPEVATADIAKLSPLTAGHDSIGQVVPAWHFQAMAGAGAVRASLADMQAYISAYLAQDLTAPLQLQLTPLHLDDNGNGMAMGWMIHQHDTYWHNGQTAGFSSFAGFNRKTGKGVVLLAAVSMADHVTNIGMQLLQR
jgi:CubicO group peptidase (beta-lactamase class C family)